MNIFALVAANRLNLKPDTSYPWIDPGKTAQEQGWDIVSLHSKWDSFWYVDIAENGYSFRGEEKLSNIVFFPLYPLVIKTVSLFTFGGVS